MIVYIRKAFLPICFCLFTIFLIAFSNDNLIAAKNGLSLWASSVVPSLFPFFIATELLSHTNIIYLIGVFLNRFMQPIFNVPGEGAFALLMGIISGYPTGAKIVSEFKKNKICNEIQCERLLAFTNNSGPLFIVGTVGTGLFFDTKIGFLLLFTHILACLSVGFLFRFWKYKLSRDYRDDGIYGCTQVSFCNLGDVLSSSIKSATNTIVMIGGFVVLFSVIISMLHNSHFFNIIGLFFGHDKYVEGFFTGLLEITNGIEHICSIPTKNLTLAIVLTSFLLGFGGISVMLQVLSITSKNNISIKPYIIGKLLHGILAAIFTFVLLKYIPFFGLVI